MYNTLNALGDSYENLPFLRRTDSRFPSPLGINVTDHATCAKCDNWQDELSKKEDCPPWVLAETFVRKSLLKVKVKLGCVRSHMQPNWHYQEMLRCAMFVWKGLKRKDCLSEVSVDNKRREMRPLLLISPPFPRPLIFLSLFTLTKCHCKKPAAGKSVTLALCASHKHGLCSCAGDFSVTPAPFSW